MLFDSRILPRRALRSRSANTNPTANAPRPSVSGSNAGRYSCILFPGEKVLFSTCHFSNSLNSDADSQQNYTDSDSNPKPSEGEGLPLRQNPIQRDKYRYQYGCLPKIFGNHLSGRLLIFHCENPSLYMPLAQRPRDYDKMTSSWRAPALSTRTSPHACEAETRREKDLSHPPFDDSCILK